MILGFNKLDCAIAPHLNKLNRDRIIIISLCGRTHLESDRQ
ncbi:hypothetical protein APA_4127 [Pseudanabaena sp. lw0831]|nr:hypothetical protein APA_4127 [Pseudanabaena sp. lw0831]